MLPGFKSAMHKIVTTGITAVGRWHPCMKDGLGSAEEAAVAKGLVRDSAGGGGAAASEDFPLLDLA